MAGNAARTAPKADPASALRFGLELVAWVATPWYFAGISWVLAVLSLVVLIGLPTVFATPGDKRAVMVAVPGWATICLVLLQLGAAVAASWAVWPAGVAVAVSVLAAVCVGTERRRWRRLLDRAGGKGFGAGASTP
ncbi:hypothetical protein SAMN05216223_103468 [Actinacidiphila yanglinensis]|uniref:Uncharacterized protein n=1 Tax=Actinacidiphila yanglinensis TaxID=310779 RepID=A0A1H5XY09_9ACTN|nr:hypothetical protein [Actinacidiphila yanglinensis]SEG16533.1 hypothetical protein SAMN05216223_103468 [Actinacidiphila yanglinensis]